MMTLCKECAFERSKDGIRTDGCDRTFLMQNAFSILDGNELVGCTGGITRYQLAVKERKQ